MAVFYSVGSFISYGMKNAPQGLHCGGKGEKNETGQVFEGFPSDQEKDGGQ